MALVKVVNEKLQALDVQYVRGDSYDELTVDGLPPIRFGEESGGVFDGGFRAWTRHRHRPKQLVHEPGTWAALLAIADLDPKIECVYDIGALYGYFSAGAAVTLGDADVIAFEVNETSSSAMKQNLALNAFGDRVLVESAALGSRSDHDVDIEIRGLGMSTAEKREYTLRERMKHIARLVNDRFRQRPTADGAQTVDVWTMDDYAQTRGRYPDLVRIDVGGYQAEILPHGMDAILKKKATVLFEFDIPRKLSRFGVTNRDLCGLFTSEGYRRLWGDHRTIDTELREMKLQDLGEAHETNSLAILYHPDQIQ